MTQKEQLMDLISKSFPVCNKYEIIQIAEIVWNATQRAFNNSFKETNTYTIKRGKEK